MLCLSTNLLKTARETTMSTMSTKSSKSTMSTMRTVRTMRTVIAGCAPRTLSTPRTPRAHSTHSAPSTHAAVRTFTDFCWDLSDCCCGILSGLLTFVRGCRHFVRNRAFGALSTLGADDQPDESKLWLYWQ